MPAADGDQELPAPCTRSPSQIVFAMPARMCSATTSRSRALGKVSFTSSVRWWFDLTRALRAELDRLAERVEDKQALPVHADAAQQLPLGDRREAELRAPFCSVSA